MGKWIQRIVVAVSAVVFFYSTAQLFIIWQTYRASAAVYNGAVEEYVEVSTFTPPPAAEETPIPEAQPDEETPPAQEQSVIPRREYVLAPIVVNFDHLCYDGSDVIGWIYCEDTRINYPVVYGRDNDFYLRHNYLREDDSSGCIFTDKNTVPGFGDYNVIVYGHYRKDHSMFGSLENWYDQGFFDDHAFMWLLTPEQDYRVDLISVYTTSAVSNTYTVFHGNGPEFERYLERAVSQSVVRSDVEIDPEAHYIVLSTCAYSFDNARTVLHGKLTPVDSAGGVPFFVLEEIKSEKEEQELSK